LTILGQIRRELRTSPAARRGGGLVLPPLLLLATLLFGAVTYVVYVLWPRWPAGPVALDAPEIPITVAGVAFSVPPAAIRVPVQRRPGALERVDLAFLWPSLKPADAAGKSSAPVAKQVTPGTLPAPGSFLDRLFVTIASAGKEMAPAERLRIIYPRYATTEPVSGPAGLAILPFRDGTPYQGEDLIYDAATPENFLVRCSRDGAGATPGTCLFEERIETADVIVRFPRDWLVDWPSIATSIDRLIKDLRPSSGATVAPRGNPMSVR
jgi:hypothetical protein